MTFMTPKSVLTPNMVKHTWKITCLALRRIAPSVAWDRTHLPIEIDIDDLKIIRDNALHNDQQDIYVNEGEQQQNPLKNELSQRVSNHKGEQDLNLPPPDANKAIIDQLQQVTQTIVTLASNLQSNSLNANASQHKATSQHQTKQLPTHLKQQQSNALQNNT